MNMIISGYCTEYNDGGCLIQRQKSSPCNETLFCDEVYWSTESYKCKKEAYDLHYNAFYLIVLKQVNQYLFRKNIYFIMEYL